MDQGNRNEYDQIVAEQQEDEPLPLSIMRLCYAIDTADFIHELLCIQQLYIFTEKGAQFGYIKFDCLFQYLCVFMIFTIELEIAWVWNNQSIGQYNIIFVSCYVI